MKTAQAVGKEEIAMKYAVNRVGELCGRWCKEQRKRLGGVVNVHVRPSCHRDRIEVTLDCERGMVLEEPHKRWISDFLLGEFKRDIRPILTKILPWEDFKVRIMSDGRTPAVRYCCRIEQRSSEKQS